MLEPFTGVPAYETATELYSDWGDPREFTIGDLGVGECAGEVVSVSQFDLADAERLAFESQVRIESEEFAQADALAYRAMLQAAIAFVKTQIRPLAGLDLEARMVSGPASLQRRTLSLPARRDARLPRPRLKPRHSLLLHDHP